MRLPAALSLVLIAASQAVAQEISVEHDMWTDLLSKYVSTPEDGVRRFDYGALKANAEDMAALETYIDELEATEISKLGADDQFAAWANLYNALTVRLIVENYPLRSIMNIKPHVFSIGPWKMEISEVEGRALTLDNIEHDILRVEWDEPRVHYAVNCASYGCPSLQLKAWEGETLDEDLSAAAREYVNHPRGVSFKSNGRLEVSRIYKWFREDFGDSNEGVVEHLKLYADPELKAQLDAGVRITGHEYDWSLNDPVQ
ncbi:MAG: DUF547 domain-containing protein [Pseudomonadota bacterium]